MAHQWKYHGSAEEWAEYLKRRSAIMKEVASRETSEARAERGRKIAEGLKRAWAKKGAAQRAEIAKKVKRTKAKMSPEARAAIVKRGVETRLANLAAMSEDEREKRRQAFRDKVVGTTDEERKAYSERMRAMAKGQWERLTAQEREARISRLVSMQELIGPIPRDVLMAAAKVRGERLRAKFAAMTPEEREEWRKQHYTKERMEKTRVKRMETMRAWSPEKKKAIARKVVITRTRNFKALPKEEREAILDKRYRSPEHRARQSQATKAWLASLPKEELDGMVARINTTEAHAKCGATHSRNLMKLTKEERRALCSQLHTPETRAKVTEGVRRWFNALPPEEKARVVAVIQAKDRIARKKGKKPRRPSEP